MKWVSITSTLALHEQQLAEHGGLEGIRDYGLLVSALSRPENIAAYEENAETDIARLERVQQKWEPVLRPDTRQDKELEQDDDSKKSHLALAAAYCHGIIKNHPFADANKRTAFAVLGLFLAKNGYDLVADDASCLESVLALASGRMTEQDFGSWTKANIAFVKAAPKPRNVPKVET